MQDERLLTILKSAYTPCTHFSGNSKETCRWRLESGWVPSGFGGARGKLSDVKLVIVAAEPGGPVDNANYEGEPIDMVKNSIRNFDEAMDNKSVSRNQRRVPAFHSNLAEILKLFWKDLDIDEIFRRTWYTNSVLCPYPSKKFGVRKSKHIKIVENTCVNDYLKPQLKLFNKPFVLALGAKARERMNQNNLEFHAEAYHPSYPISKIKKHQCWEAAASEFLNFLSKG